MAEISLVVRKLLLIPQPSVIALPIPAPASSQLSAIIREKKIEATYKEAVCKQQFFS
jgi:hypothetical protein